MAKERYAIYKNVFDEFTIRNLEVLRNKYHIDELLSPITIGKESNIFLADTPKGEIVVVKIYRVHSCNFNKMYSYIRSDPRFMDIKNQRRMVILKWVEREFDNLEIAHEVITAPKPIALENNIIVMESIGRNRPAPQLKDAIPKEPQAFLEKILASLRKLSEEGLVHADISEFNILNRKERPVFIDFSQATHILDSQALNYHERDLGNLRRFFAKLEIPFDIRDELAFLEKLIERKRAK